jgi:hypothetical protein
MSSGGGGGGLGQRGLFQIEQRGEKSLRRYGLLAALAEMYMCSY